MADNFTDSRDLITAPELAARLSQVTLIDPRLAEDCALGNSLDNCRKDIAVKQVIPDLITLALLCMTSALLLAIPSAQADYVASAQEERDWAARIAKVPPDAATLGGAPYPGARIDNKRSSEKTAENRGEPMVYVYLARASLADVRAYYNGAGKREAGVPVLSQGSGVVEILYYIRKNKPAAVAAQPARAMTPAPAAASDAAANEGTAAATPAPQAPAAADTAKQAIDAVNALKGLFGR